MVYSTKCVSLTDNSEEYNPHVVVDEPRYRRFCYAGRSDLRYFEVDSATVQLPLDSSLSRFGVKSPAHALFLGYFHLRRETTPYRMMKFIT